METTATTTLNALGDRVLQRYFKRVNRGDPLYGFDRIRAAVAARHERERMLPDPNAEHSLNTPTQASEPVAEVHQVVPEAPKMAVPSRQFHNTAGVAVLIDDSFADLMANRVQNIEVTIPKEGGKFRQITCLGVEVRAGTEKTFVVLRNAELVVALQQGKLAGQKALLTAVMNGSKNGVDHYALNRVVSKEPVFILTAKPWEEDRVSNMFGIASNKTFAVAVVDPKLDVEIDVAGKKFKMKRGNVECPYAHIVSEEVIAAPVPPPAPTAPEADEQDNGRNNNGDTLPERVNGHDAAAPEPNVMVANPEPEPKPEPTNQAQGSTEVPIDLVAHPWAKRTTGADLTGAMEIIARLQKPGTEVDDERILLAAAHLAGIERQMMFDRDMVTYEAQRAISDYAARVNAVLERLRREIPDECEKVRACRNQLVIVLPKNKDTSD